jgi:hypothetical protein
VLGIDNVKADPRIVCVDVDYRDPGTVAAGLWFHGWPSASSPWASKHWNASSTANLFAACMSASSGCWLWKVNRSTRGFNSGGLSQSFWHRDVSRPELVRGSRRQSVSTLSGHCPHERSFSQGIRECTLRNQCNRRGRWKVAFFRRRYIPSGRRRRNRCCATTMLDESLASTSRFHASCLNVRPASSRIRLPLLS